MLLDLVYEPVQLSIVPPRHGPSRNAELVLNYYVLRPFKKELVVVQALTSHIGFRLYLL